jgi:ribosome-associated protein
MTVKRVTSTSESALKLAKLAARVAAENRGSNIVVLDLRDQVEWVDYFVIATGTSSRQLRAISDEIEAEAKSQLSDSRRGSEGYGDAAWMLLDFGDVVVHLFSKEAREHYAIEDLWGRAQRVDLTEVLKGVGPIALAE